MWRKCVVHLCISSDLDLHTHTGGIPVTSADVFFNPDTFPEKREAFSSVPGANVGSVEREDSIPLPEAGFTVRAKNGIGATEVACPGLTIDPLPLLRSWWQKLALIRTPRSVEQNRHSNIL